MGLDFFFKKSEQKYTREAQISPEKPCTLSPRQSLLFLPESHSLRGDTHIS